MTLLAITPAGHSGSVIKEPPARPQDWTSNSRSALRKTRPGGGSGGLSSLPKKALALPDTALTAGHDVVRRLLSSGRVVNSN